ncbi:MAG TPA: FAD-binding oxidoreductase, partial [Blastocatellia bacterium]|nr:FAD-binding oxidoreductase [Blastocatellia bacterium]
TFSGQLLQPSDAQYDDVRRVHNGLVDKRPALIARCLGTADVADAVRLARTLNLEVAVRGGGHNVAGRATIDDGLMIDLSLMKGIHVDPKAPTARAQGGVLWKEFNRETQLHGLATTGGVVGTTGLAGLTLGGGLGWLMPKYGLALDNLRSAEMVLADGAVCRASADENPDLFWAIRGGGGNFGIAASLEYDLHPVGPVVAGGLVAHPLQSGAAALRFFRDTCATLPDEMMLVAGLLTAPDGSGAKLTALVAGHCGSLADGEAALRPLKAFGQPAMDAMGPIPYCSLNALFDPGLPKGALNYWKSQFLTDLSDDCIATLLEHFAAAPSPMSQIVIEHFHGAASRVPVPATACAMRITGFNAVLISQWTDPRDTDKNVSWCRDIYAALAPYLGTFRYLNYLDQDDGDDPAVLAYGPNYSRLRDLKRKYDPDNFFHTNVNIRPR